MLFQFSRIRVANCYGRSSAWSGSVRGVSGNLPFPMTSPARSCVPNVRSRRRPRRGFRRRARRMPAEEPEMEFADYRATSDPALPISAASPSRPVKRRRYEELRTISLVSKIFAGLIGLITLRRCWSGWGRS